MATTTNVTVAPYTGAVLHPPVLCDGCFDPATHTVHVPRRGRPDAPDGQGAKVHMCATHAEHLEREHTFDDWGDPRMAEAIRLGQALRAGTVTPREFALGMLEALYGNVDVPTVVGR